FVIDRSFLTDKYGDDAWKVSPFDIGEILYHWRSGRVFDQYLDTKVFEELGGWQRPLSETSQLFRTFLDEGYEDPADYLDSWAPPRPSLDFGHLRNAVYRAASDRWFGRVRPFAPGWTFEVSCEGDVELPLDYVRGVFLIDDG